jgi:D-alanyl-lipoteichoic acid acyltransferase DltB (MBOAT superfamily)
MNMPMLKSRGRESTTLNFVAASWLAMTVMFMWKGTAADILTYGSAVGAILLVWLGREWTEKVSVPKMETRP